MGKGTRRVAWIVLQLCLLEVACFAVGKLLQSRRKMFAPPETVDGVEAESWAQYAARRDPMLGWPASDELGGAKYDETGARRLPDFTGSPESRVSLYGDSFTYGDEVDDEHAWGNLLARKLGARVSNYGVGGYGTDQAYLRYVQNVQDRSPVVVLGHLSENILRNLTRDRDLLNFTRWYALKPRFLLDGSGGLRLLELPQLDETQYLRSVGLASPFLPLEDETFQPGGPAGATDLTFPFTFSIVRNLSDFRMAAWIHRRPEYEVFYDEGSPLHGVQITVGICVAFAREAERRGQRPLVVLFPTRADMNNFRLHGRWTYASLAEGLKRAKIEFLDFGPRFAEYIGERDARNYFMPRAHYNAEIYHLVSEAVYERLEQLGAGR